MSTEKRIVSFSLYGDIPLYTVGAIENAELVHRIYPGWTARFYVDDSVSAEVCGALSTRGAEIIRVTAPSLGPMYGRYWRAWIASEARVERFIVRDVDSRLNSREKAAVDAWIASKKTFHIMRDSKFHARRVLAGMWGGLGQCVPSMRQLTDSWGLYEKPGENDQFMSACIFPLMESNYLCHDNHNHFGDAQPFPHHRPMSGTSYVGEVVTTDVQAKDAWRQLAEYSEELIQAHERIALDMQLIQSLQSIPDAPRSLRMVLPLARLLRACAVRLGYTPPISTSRRASPTTPAKSLPRPPRSP